MFLLGLAIFLLGVVFSMIVLGGNVANFIDVPSLSIILCALLGVLTATGSFKLFYAGLRAAIFPKQGISKEMRIKAVSLFRLLSKTSVMASAISVLIGFVNMLMNLNFEDTSNIYVLGINIAFSLISLFYGLLLSVAVFEPVAFILKKSRHK